jgi:predicted DNA-binding protein
MQPERQRGVLENAVNGESGGTQPSRRATLLSPGRITPQHANFHSRNRLLRRRPRELPAGHTYWTLLCSTPESWCFRWRFIVAGIRSMRIGIRASQPCLARDPTTMSDKRAPRHRRRAGRPPAGAREGEKVKDYPQLSIRVPIEMKARLNALSAVTGLAQWRVVVEAIDCFVHDLPEPDRELVDGLSERLIRAI